jgi:hypothetical protein
LTIEDTYAHAQFSHTTEQFKVFIPAINSETGKKAYSLRNYGVLPTHKLEEIFFDEEHVLHFNVGQRENDTPKPELFSELVSAMQKALPFLEDESSTLLTFFRLISDGTFPKNNISIQLFLDVVRWHGNKTKMTYSNDVKKFWTVGYKLFKGKFLHFMKGDMKGDVKENQSDINFAVPSFPTIEAAVKEFGFPKPAPGILSTNVDRFKDTNQSYKLCIDGKLIARGFGKQHGEVDLYGHEQSPILTDRKKRLQEEQDQVSSIETGLTPFTDESEQDHLPDTETVQDITDKTCPCISLLSHR